MSKPKEPRASSETRAFNVLLEQLKSQMDAVLEAVNSSRVHLEAKIDGVEERLSERIRVLEDVVRQNSADIRKNSDDIRKNSDDIRELREEVARLRHDFDHRAELGRIAELEERVAKIERRLGA